MKNWSVVFISIILIAGSCCMNRYDYSINDLEKYDVSFNSLSDEMKEFFYKIKDIPSTEKYEFSLQELINLDTNHDLQIETVKTKIGPWIDYYLLLDKTNNISYKIDYGTPFPIIIFDKKAFIPQEYNLFSFNSFETLNFDCYSLKNAKK